MNRSTPPPLQLLTPHHRAAVSAAARERARELRDEAQHAFWATLGRALQRALASLRSHLPVNGSRRCPS